MNIRYKFLYIFFTFMFSIEVNAAVSAKELYLNNCMVCHAEDGSGAMPGVSDLNKNRVWITMDEKKLLNRLKKGIENPGSTMMMPAKGGNQDLTDIDLKEIILYMRKTFTTIDSLKQGDIK